MDAWESGSCGPARHSVAASPVIFSHLADLFRSQFWIFSGAMEHSQVRCMCQPVCPDTWSTHHFCRDICSLRQTRLYNHGGPHRGITGESKLKSFLSETRASETGGAPEEGGCLR